MYPHPPANESRHGTTLLRGFRQLWDGYRTWSDAAVLLDGARVAWVGPDRERPAAARVVELDGTVALPGLVDCHTHTVFAGTRVGDFARRLGGESYAGILQAGGGVHHTVRETRAASEAELVATARLRLDAMLRRGVTTVEVKSGYGLDAASEAKLLRAARAAAGPVEVVTTFLVHVPPADRPREGVLRDVIEVQLPACAPLAAAVDVWCDPGAYTLDEAVAVLRAARARGLPIKAHAEQVGATGIARAAAELGALSCDHLERVDDAGIEAMARAGTVAVLLPGAMLYLADVPPPVAKLRAAGVRLAIATDFNPGSSPVPDLRAAATLAAITLRLSVAEVLAAITRHAADALGRPELGRLLPGAAGDVAVFRPPPGEPADLGVLVQYLDGTPAAGVWKAGQRVV